LLLIQPFLNLIVLAFGTMSVPAGMVAVADFIALRTLVDMPTKFFGTTTLKIPYGLQVAGDDLVPVLV
jgi:hypothetical protein